MASLLYFTSGDPDPVAGGSHRVRAVTVPLPGARRAERLLPIVRTWALVQAGRAALASASPSAENGPPSPARGAPLHRGRLAAGTEPRAREALRLLMGYPVVDVLALVLAFAYA